MGKKAAKRAGRRAAAKGSCLTRNAKGIGSPGKHSKHSAQPERVTVPTKTTKLKLGSKRPGAGGLIPTGPSVQKLALKRRREQEAAEREAERGRALGVAYAGERAACAAPAGAVIAPASFSVDEPKESGDLQWLFDVDVARDPAKAARKRRPGGGAAAPAEARTFTSLPVDEDAPAPEAPAPAAPAAPATFAFAPASFSVPRPGDFEDI